MDTPRICMEICSFVLRIEFCFCIYKLSHAPHISRCHPSQSTRTCHPSDSRRKCQILIRSHYLLFALCYCVSQHSWYAYIHIRSSPVHWTNYDISTQREWDPTVAAITKCGQLQLHALTRGRGRLSLMRLQHKWMANSLCFFHPISVSAHCCQLCRYRLQTISPSRICMCTGYMLLFLYLSTLVCFGCCTSRHTRKFILSLTLYALVL